MLRIECCILILFIMSKNWICPECRSVFTEDDFKAGLLGEVCPICGHPLGRVKPPTSLPPKPSVSYKQLGILVLDGSGSMVTKTKELTTKAEAVSKSVTEFFDMMKVSRINNHFCFAVVDFDKKAYRKLGVTETENIDTRADYNPVHVKGGVTYLYSGLEEAERIADEFLGSSDKGTRSVVVVIMTDGLDMNEGKAKETADRMKEKYGEGLKITASCFGTRDISDSDRTKIMAFLKTIVTDETMCLETSSAEELRSFFIRSVSR